MPRALKGITLLLVAVVVVIISAVTLSPSYAYERSTYSGTTIVNEKSSESTSSTSLIDSGSYVEDTSGDPFFGGVTGTLYQTTNDMPLTYFVLDLAPIDISSFFAGSLKAAEIQYAGRPRLLASIKEKITTMQLEQGPAMEQAISGAKDGFKLMFTTIPFMILSLMFMFQLLNLAYAHLTDPLVAGRFSVWTYVVRLIVFFIAIAFFVPVVRWAVEFSNAAADFLVSVGEQNKINTLILYKLIATKPGSNVGTLGAILSYLMRSLAYISIKILLILRDTLMAVTILVGPVCIAIGYYSSVTTPEGDPIRGYLSGWLENFMKLLFWGPFAAIMMSCMGIFILINTLEGISLMYIIVMSLAFLVAARGIPNLADKMSAVSVLAIMGIIMPAVGALTGGAVGLGGTGVWLAGTAGARGVGRLISNSSKGVSSSTSGGNTLRRMGEGLQGGVRTGQRLTQEVEGEDGVVPQTDAPRVDSTGLKPPTS